MDIEDGGAEAEHVGKQPCVSKTTALRAYTFLGILWRVVFVLCDIYALATGFTQCEPVSIAAYGAASMLASLGGILLLITSSKQHGLKKYSPLSDTHHHYDLRTVPPPSRKPGLGLVKVSNVLFTISLVLGLWAAILYKTHEDAPCRSTATFLFTLLQIDAYLFLFVTLPTLALLLLGLLLFLTCLRRFLVNSFLLRSVVSLLPGGRLLVTCLVPKGKGIPLQNILEVSSLVPVPKINCHYCAKPVLTNGVALQCNHIYHGVCLVQYQNKLFKTGQSKITSCGKHCPGPFELRDWKRYKAMLKERQKAGKGGAKRIAMEGVEGNDAKVTAKPTHAESPHHS